MDPNVTASPLSSASASLYSSLSKTAHDRPSVQVAQRLYGLIVNATTDRALIAPLQEAYRSFVYSRNTGTSYDDALNAAFQILAKGCEARLIQLHGPVNNTRVEVFNYLVEQGVFPFTAFQFSLNHEFVGRIAQLRNGTKLTGLDESQRAGLLANVVRLCRDGMVCESVVQMMRLDLARASLPDIAKVTLAKFDLAIATARTELDKGSRTKSVESLGGSERLHQLSHCKLFYLHLMSTLTSTNSRVGRWEENDRYAFGLARTAEAANAMEIIMLVVSEESDLAVQERILGEFFGRLADGKTRAIGAESLVGIARLVSSEFRAGDADGTKHRSGRSRTGESRGGRTKGSDQ